MKEALLFHVQISPPIKDVPLVVFKLLLEIWPELKFLCFSGELFM